MRTFQPKQPEQPEQGAWKHIVLPLSYKVGVYPRQSTLMQVKNYKESTEMQTTDLIAFARSLGWKDEQIVVFSQDLGLSGKLRIDEREGLRSLVECIESDEIKAVIVFLEDRLFRDETQIQVNVFIDICRQHNTIVITPQMTYDFSNIYHVKQFRWKCEAAADFLREYVMQRLHGAKERVSQRGDYDGRGISVGFIVDRRQTIMELGREMRNPSYMKFMIYEPHAIVVRRLFERYFELGGKARVLYREIQELPYLFPEFGADVDRRDVVKCKLKKVPGGYHLSYSGLRDLLTNIVYIGWWIYQERISKNNHAAIIEEDLFWYAFSHLSTYTPDGELNPDKPKRSRYQRIASQECHALLKDCIITTALKRGAYVTYKFRDWYYILRNTNAHDLKDTHITTIPVKAVDALFTEKLLEHLRDTPHFEHYEQYAQQARLDSEKECVSIQAQLKEIDRQLAGIRQSLMLPPDVLDEVARRELAQKHRSLQTTKESLTKKLESATGTTRAEELLTYRELIAELATRWHSLAFSDRKILVDMLCEQVILDEVAPHWLSFTICWRDPSWEIDNGWIWRNQGGIPTWTEEELTILHEYYSDSPKEVMLSLLPRRSWQSILEHANKTGITRSVNTRHKDAIPINVTLADWQFMQEHGICKDALLTDIQCIWCR